jgi:tetratricopeptide (TPR) repeat protein
MGPPVLLCSDDRSYEELKMKKAHIDSAASERLFEDAELKEELGDLGGAFKSHLAAAQLGNTLSQLAVGNFYANGTGVPKSFEDAAQWYKKAYRNGVSAAAINLSIELLDQGNTRGAIEWLKRAIDMNDGEAVFQLARIYLEMPRGKKKAIELLRKTQTLKRYAEISEQSQKDAAGLLSSIDKG